MDDSGFDSDPKQLKVNEDEQLFPVSDSSSSSVTTHCTPKKNNRKDLQKKLERRIEQAKKLQNLQDLKKNSPLIPIQRLQIPCGKNSIASNSAKEHHPLVDWDSDESEEDINFFPVSRLRDGKQELTDTFSIEEFDVTPDDEDDLDLLPPKSLGARSLCCHIPLPSSWRCVIL